MRYKKPPRSCDLEDARYKQIDTNKTNTKAYCRRLRSIPSSYPRNALFALCPVQAVASLSDDVRIDASFGIMFFP